MKPTSPTHQKSQKPFSPKGPSHQTNRHWYLATALAGVLGVLWGLFWIGQWNDWQRSGETAEMLPHATSDFLIHYEEPQPLNYKLVKQAIGYPEVAKAAGIEGQVVVRVLIDEKGMYLKHKMIKKVHPILAEVVENHLSSLQFSPFTSLQGKKRKYWVNVPFRFKLEEQG
jgi:TonB family protein